MGISITGITFPRPDFNIVGMTLDNGWVRLLASMSLSYAELRLETTRQDVYWDYGDVLPAASFLASYDIILSTHMHRVVVIDAPDYPTAFEALFKQWKPEPSRRTGIEQGQRAIDPPNKAIERLCTRTATSWAA